MISDLRTDDRFPRRASVALARLARRQPALHAELVALARAVRCPIGAAWCVMTRNPWPAIADELRARILAAAPLSAPKLHEARERRLALSNR